ncbi:MAG: hypothetical protein CFE29_23515 [Bradyrhizobiaceae bacterium PARB1]|jgi:hypothetical protein|nr:MAG: hypothetical protein CFE29_23515 [Bradyrhizobiaceae bacterium PARB1]PSO27331.1 hypothetical protein C7G43_10345 [Bradyrhizobium sp. MOS004]HAQ80483.1 hypothetical protein [Bradyrhizobium sp.]HAR12781.1 hypothetical protein [Bradyrhizobium sp.]HAR26631.1 hypothetical protein [Bradyrhizobium sp.]
MLHGRHDRKSKPQLTTLQLQSYAIKMNSAKRLEPHDARSRRRVDSGSRHGRRLTAGRRKADRLASEVDCCRR